MNNVFIVVLRYVVTIEVIDSHRAEHLDFLDEYYANGIFVASGMQNPRTGGIIIAKCDNRIVLHEILKKDPFYTENLAEYQIFEFCPNKYSEAFKGVLS